MKKALVGIIIVALLAVGVPCIISLTNDTGTYEFESMTSNGLEIKEGDEYLGATVSKSYQTLKIDRNGSFEMTGSVNAKGTWTKEGSTIILKPNGGTSIRVYRNGFVITIQSGNNELKLKKSIFSF